MSDVGDFCRDTLRERIAPPTLGSVKARIRHAARRLGWTYTRTRDAWYADPRISISGQELADIETRAGVRYARMQMEETEAAIRRAAEMLVANATDSGGLLGAVVVEAARILAGAGAEAAGLDGRGGRR